MALGAWGVVGIQIWGSSWDPGFHQIILKYDLEYADDTLLLARTIPQVQSFLASVEKVASEYGMKLNDTKTELLTKTPNENTT